MLERLELLVGKENIEKLKEARVLVIGIGGVGGYAVEALARSGIGNLFLIDHDVVEESNINRQLIALQSTIGQKKVNVMRDRIQDMGLNTNVQVADTFVDSKNLESFLSSVDYVIDACDTLSTKFTIIEQCLAKGIPFISSMGTGNKLDPSLFKIMRLEDTSYDPLAKRLRKMVKDSHVKGKIMVVSSSEPKQQEGKKVIPSNAFVPGTAGLLCASYIIRQIISR